MNIMFHKNKIGSTKYLTPVAGLFLMRLGFENIFETP